MLEAKLICPGIEPLFERMEYIFDYAQAAVHNNFPFAAVGIEDVWVGPNRQVSINLAKVWGIVFAAVIPYCKNVVSISPSTAKKALTGKGRASKDEVLTLVQERYYDTDSQDIADAIAVGVAVERLLGNH